MLEKTFKALEQTFQVLEKEVSDILKGIPKTKIKGTKIKIGKGSTVNINGTSATLLNDVIVVTQNPNKLMCKE
jgi:hypothetical protein